MHKIRPERESDAAEISAVTRAAFAPEGDVEVTLVDLLRSRGKAVISFVATEGEQVVGHALFSEVTVKPNYAGLRLLGLAPLSVHPDHQGRGVGSDLVERGLEECRTAGYGAVVVFGEPTYYGRFGFEKASAHGMSNEYRVDDPFMVVGLTPGALRGLAGTAAYAPEFIEVGA